MKKRTIFLFVLALLFSLSFSDLLMAHCGICGSRRKHRAKVEEHKSAAKELMMKKEATINSSGLMALISAQVPVTILDARSGKYDDGVRIPGAKALSDASPIDDVKKLLPDRKALIVTYCANPKCPASSKLFKKLKGLGYVNLIEYPGGIDGWKKAGYPTTMAK